ncbi:hypothetical protein LCGC14_3146000 [marine sediment metagenome]|uniref:Uncharacterized protein n=1 Tax=marine sediment metagenome TaxID=412755 RepID=A0A0F8WJJ6_9ZZZZ
MVKIKLFDDEEVDKSEAFLDLVKHGPGFALVLTDGDGVVISQPFILFLEPNSSGKITLSLAMSPNGDYVDRSDITNTIRVNPSH